MQRLVGIDRDDRVDAHPGGGETIEVTALSRSETSRVTAAKARQDGGLGIVHDHPRDPGVLHEVEFQDLIALGFRSPAQEIVR